MARRERPEDLGRQLRPLFSKDGPLMLGLAEIQRTADQMALALATEDLVSEAGRLGALRTQGRIEGLRSAISLLTTPVMEILDEQAS